MSATRDYSCRERSGYDAISTFRRYASYIHILKLPAVQNVTAANCADAVMPQAQVQVDSKTTQKSENAGHAVQTAKVSKTQKQRESQINLTTAGTIYASLQNKRGYHYDKIRDDNFITHQERVPRCAEIV